MASPWRRRRICQLIVDGIALPVALRDVDARGARLDIAIPLALRSPVELRHPEAGAIRARVSEFGDGGIRIAFDGGEASVAFALAAITADMTSGG
ncbi:hypothetical protein ASD39_19820 [Sphingomonas sp. Root50]|nr:hypothetical protein ASD17_15155 [Sphingomonas sp. Root1294]KQY72387.1 hypothetical protein ASD39_19820 [Sphingomonas sp. Root50]KRB95477.1 hypothetical protein ASE22_00930 [Sphingomonas sp. Root720]